MHKEYELFGEKINIRNNVCCSSLTEVVEGKFYLNLYVKVTDYCGADCKFCSNQSAVPDEENIDLNKYAEVISHLNEKKLLNRISFTGGEPLLYINRLDKILQKTFEVLPSAEVTLNTNGINLDKIFELKSLDKIEGIHISRHHYEDKKNNQIFGVKTASIAEIRHINNKLLDKKKLRLNCLLMKDYISSQNEVKSYLEQAASADIYRVGFVSLMKINNFSIEQFVNFNDIFQNLDDSFFIEENLYDKHICECVKGSYFSQSAKLVEYYARMTKELNCDYVRQISYLPNNEISFGFNGKKIKL